MTKHKEIKFKMDLPCLLCDSGRNVGMVGYVCGECHDWLVEKGYEVKDKIECSSCEAKIDWNEQGCCVDCLKGMGFDVSEEVAS